MDTNPEIGLSIDVDGITTNYHRAGSGPVVLLVHGSGPGVSAWANWRLTIPAHDPAFATDELATLRYEASV